MDDKALHALEFPAVLDRLSRLTSFSAGRERALALRPSTDREAVVERQRLTAEALRLLRMGVQVSLGGAHDVREAALGAARGQVLPAADLLEVASTVRAGQRIRRALAAAEDHAPLLATIAEDIPDLGPVRQVIDESVDDRGEVLDSASPELASIRRELATAHARLQQRMQALLGSSEVRSALQDAIVTVREGRYVLPVRSEARGAVRGVVHDTSASGATVFIEPLAVVDLGNRWRELQMQERHEIERILRDLSSAVGAVADDVDSLVDRLAEVDLALAKGRLGLQLASGVPSEAGPAQSWLVDAPAELRLVSARHPLLHGDVVPNTIEVGGDFRALLITGPNTGGKTVALKTAGLLCAMALAGLPLPAEAGSQVPVYEQVFADIGDEQSIEQSLSTFSGHMTAIIDVIERADARSLVLLDELGAGTDPTEGAALAIAIVDRLLHAGASLIATTHHSELKLYAHQTPGVTNASVEFNVESLSPTYELRIGLPGQSNAVAIAARLGMPADVVEAAREGVAGEQRDVEQLLGELRSQLNRAEDDATQARSDRAAAEAARADLERRLAALVSESTQLREEAHDRVRAEVADAERLLRRMRRRVEAARLEQAAADLERAQRAAAALAPVAPPIEAPAPTEAAPTEAAPAAASPAPRRRPRPHRPTPPDLTTIAPGQVVWLRGIPSPGEALTTPDAEGEFDVQLGPLRTRVRVQQVERTGNGKVGVDFAMRTYIAPTPDVGTEIEVRGQRLDEALPQVERFIDQASAAGLHRVRVIHGRGTGTLRRAVRDMLEHHPLVTRFEGAEQRDGGEGVTIVYLAAED
ncbi:MAG: Smr/MutS family protein [Dehalococcoidia bacterium]|nr:Smr/MutS family protein [Dehalococcoidia bacterium]